MPLNVRAYREQRGASDRSGDLAWASSIASRALKAEDGVDAERDLELVDAERLLWRLLRLPRRPIELETCGVFPVEECRAFLRALVVAGAASVVDKETAKALIPAEVRRTRAQLEGKTIAAAIPLKARVFRPDIGLGDAGFGDASHGDASHRDTGFEAAAGLGTPDVGRGSSGGSSTPPPPEGASPVVRTPTPPVAVQPSDAADGALSEEETALKASLERAFEQHKTQNHYEFLGVPRGVDEGGVRTAYMRLARELHPDRVAGTRLARDPAIRALVDELFKRLGDAYATLGNTESRVHYDRSLALAAANPTTSDGKGGTTHRRPVEARSAFMMGETHFKKKDHQQAEVHYRQAAMFDPDDPKYATALAWCIYHNPGREQAERSDDAKTRLLEILKKKRYGDASYKLGRVLRDLGDEDAAVKRFHDACDMDSRHVEAMREVRLANMRKEKDDAVKKQDVGVILNKHLKR